MVLPRAIHWLILMKKKTDYIISNENKIYLRCSMEDSGFLVFTGIDTFIANGTNVGLKKRQNLGFARQLPRWILA